MRFLILLCIIALQVQLSAAQGFLSKQKQQVKLEWHALSDAINSADTTNKLVLIHVYRRTDAVSARMEKDVYMHPQVVELLNKYFYVVRLDFDEDKKLMFNGKMISEKALAKVLGVRATPTTVFMNSEGTAIASQPGGMDAKTFHKLAAYVGSGAYALSSFEEYEYKPDKQ